MSRRFIPCFVVTLMFGMDVETSKVSGVFVRSSFQQQNELAAIVSNSLKSNIYNNIRYVEASDGKKAVLSVAAQKAFKTSNTYMQYYNKGLKSDDVGVYCSYN